MLMMEVLWLECVWDSNRSTATKKYLPLITAYNCLVRFYSHDIITFLLCFIQKKRCVPLNVGSSDSQHFTLKCVLYLRKFKLRLPLLFQLLLLFSGKTFSTELPVWHLKKIILVNISTRRILRLTKCLNYKQNNCVYTHKYCNHAF